MNGAVSRPSGQLYDRRSDEVSLDEVERILMCQKVCLIAFVNESSQSRADTTQSHRSASRQSFAPMCAPALDTDRLVHFD